MMEKVPWENNGLGKRLQNKTGKVNKAVGINKLEKPFLQAAETALKGLAWSQEGRYNQGENRRMRWKKGD